MRKILTLCTFWGVFLSITANPVDQGTAQVIAAKFMATNDLHLVATYQTDNNIAAFYVFNTTDGFVIVSADDCETPIIGYSHEGRFDPNNVPLQMVGYLQDFVNRIQYGIENQIVDDEFTTKQWELVKATGQLNEAKHTKSVGPLLTEKWNQGCRYNSLCPEMQGPCDHSEAGCVAVAMGQIMHYWKYPATGFGSHSYTNSGITLSADFGNTTYDWEHMPDSLTENSSEAEIEAVATLLFHCGVSVDMRYTTHSSLANSSDVPNAMMLYFSYSRRIHLEKRDDHSDEEWLSLLKNNLDLQRPVYYSGRGGQGGHAFVCDGYDSNDMLHFNWGWGVANGYFALGSLNPLGLDFNNNQSAILDIIPVYEPCIITASAFPSNAGVIEGTGEHHIGEQCTLKAIPNEHAKFLYWKKGGRIVSNESIYTFSVIDDIDDMVAVFSFFPVNQVSANLSPNASNPNSPNVSLNWTYVDNQWKLLKQFEINGEQDVASDGEHIYTCNYAYNSNASPFTFGKYTMDGELVELFNIEGAYPDGMTCDGNYFYISNNKNNFNVFYLYRYDFLHKTLIDSTYVKMQFTECAYDAENDGFWLYHGFGYSNNPITLVNRQGERIMNSLPVQGFLSMKGYGAITAKDGNSHLLIVTEHGHIYDYDIENNTFIHEQPLIDNGIVSGVFIGKYDGKDALFVVYLDYSTQSSKIKIYEINCHLEQIIGYRIYRADSEGNTIMLANNVAGSSYIDETWENAKAGMYRFGISEIFSNGVESEIIWSDFIKKTDYAIDEIEDEPNTPSVQKVFENGQIIIIKNGKRYSVSGQHLN